MIPVGGGDKDSIDGFEFNTLFSHIAGRYFAIASGVEKNSWGVFHIYNTREAPTSFQTLFIDFIVINKGDFHFSVVYYIYRGVIHLIIMIPAKVKELFERTQLVSFGTADKEGNPNVVPILWKRILDGGRIILLDNFMRTSKENVLENDRVCLSIWDLDSEEAYKLKGNAVYHSRGSIYEVGREFMQSKGRDQVPRGVVEVTVTGVYAIKPGPDAGKRIA